MSNLPEFELYVPPRREKRQGLGSTVLRALVVMGCLDVVLVAIWASGGFDGAAPDQILAAAAPTVVATPLPAPTPPIETAARAEPKVEPGARDELVATTPRREAEPIILRPKAPEPAVDVTAPMTAPAPESTTRTAIALPPEPPPAPTATAVPAVVAPPIAIETQPSAEAGKETSAVAMPSRKPERPHAGSRAIEHRRNAPLAHMPKEPVRAAPSVAVATVPGAAIPAAAPEPVPQVPQRAAASAACKPYFSATSLSGERIPVRGIACPGADGVWHIITERRIGD
jgi:hypothetical protein